ncbi:hypothetical protein [Acetobacterium wieringae]|nr:hypothetical protein [Acetobacterium wieringae]
MIVIISEIELKDREKNKPCFLAGLIFLLQKDKKEKLVFRNEYSLK